MNLLLALLAFAGVMAFLSTVVSVFVEGLHKTFALRRAGLEEMLRSLHTNVLVHLDPKGGDTATPETSEEQSSAEAAATNSQAARHFARQMTRNVALGGQGMFSWIRKIPIISSIFQPHHDRLSTLQFVEQLARSNVGQDLKTLSRGARQRVLTAAAYEFERFGDAQRSYFSSRARVISVICALAFAFAANVDAVNIFNRLYNDVSLRDNVIALLNSDRVQQGQSLVDTRAQGGELNAEEAAALHQQAARTVEQLSTLGLPVGYSAYPYCYGDASTLDQRCPATPSTKVNALAGVQQLKTDPAKAWLWVLSVIIAGGFIGLGAPFWFGVFRGLAQIVPAAQSVRGAISGPTTSPNAPPPGAVRDPGSAHPDSLLLAFDVASGNVAASVADPSISTALDVTRSSSSGAGPSSDGARQYR